MAAHYLTEIRALHPEGPYFLGGACFGGILALEVAQQLHAQGQQVALLVLFDARPRANAPSRTATASPVALGAYLTRNSRFTSGSSACWPRRTGVPTCSYECAISR